MKSAVLSTYVFCFTLKALTTKAQFMLRQSRYFEISHVFKQAYQYSITRKLGLFIYTLKL